MDLISIDGLRMDGRKPSELRQISCELGTAPHADGSAILSMGISKCLATVKGPLPGCDSNRSHRTVRQPTVTCTCLMTALSGATSRKTRAKGDRRTVDLQALVSSVVQQSIVPDILANNKIDVSVTILEAHGGIEACAINAAVVAVADAGIPLRELTGTCSAGILQGQYVLDLSHYEEITRCPRLFLSWQATQGKAAVIQTYSRMDPEQLTHMMEIAAAGCEQVHNEMQRALTLRLKEMAITMGGCEEG